MKTIALFSLVTLSLASFPIRTAAASAPDAGHPVVSAAKEAARSSDVVIGRSGNTRGPRVDASNATSKTQSKSAPRFDEVAAAASQNLSQAAKAANVWASDFNKACQDITATPAATLADRRLYAALARTQAHINKGFPRINAAITQLATARNARAAAAECNSTARSTHDQILLLRRDFVDLAGLMLVATGHKEAGNALIIKGHKIMQPPFVSLRKLASKAHSEAEAFSAQAQQQAQAVI